MSARFYFPEIGSQQQVTLEGTEAHHLINVLRFKTGAEVELFDGLGNAWSGTVQQTNRKTADIELKQQTAVATEPNRKIILATAAPKGDRFRWMVEKVTELGVDVLQPLCTERSVVEPRQGKFNKLTQTMIAACKQCHRNRLMEINASISWQECLEQYSENSQILIGHPQGTPVRTCVALLPVDQNIVIAIGPEGGWTDEELKLGQQHGAHQVQMGTYIQRIETAAVAMASQFL